MIWATSSVVRNSKPRLKPKVRIYSSRPPSGYRWRGDVWLRSCARPCPRDSEPLPNRDQSYPEAKFERGQPPREPDLGFATPLHRASVSELSLQDGLDCASNSNRESNILLHCLHLPKQILGCPRHWPYKSYC